MSDWRIRKCHFTTYRILATLISINASIGGNIANQTIIMIVLTIDLHQI